MTIVVTVEANFLNTHAQCKSRHTIIVMDLLSERSSDYKLLEIAA